MPSHQPASGQYALPGLLLVLSIIWADQYAKWVIIETVLRTEGDVSSFWQWFFTKRPLEYFMIERENYNSLAVAPFLNFVMVWNQGVSFGLFDTNAKFMPLVFIAISMVISLPLLIWMGLTAKKHIAVALAMICGGAIGNIIDRVRFGAVADFIDVYYKGWHWPAFNLADSCIVLGAGILIVDALFKKEKA